MPKKKSTKKGKGKKGGKKGGKKKKTTTAEREPLSTIYPWDVDCNLWMGKMEVQRRKLRPEFRTKYTAVDNLPLYDKTEWGVRLFDNSQSGQDLEVEEMITLLVVILRFEGSRKNPPDNVAMTAAAIRALNNDANLLRMRQVLFTFYQMLDCNPSPQCILDELKTTDGHAPCNDNIPNMAALGKIVEAQKLSFGDDSRAQREEMQRKLDQTSSAEEKEEIENALQQVELDRTPNLKIKKQVSITEAFRSAEKGSFEGTVHEKTLVTAATTKRSEKQTEDLKAKHVGVDKFLDLETAILSTASNDAEMRTMWNILDINNDGTVSFHEVMVFISIHYPIMTARVPARMAFDDCAEKASRELVPLKFKAFLLKLYYFSRFWAAFVRIDDNGDQKIELHEWTEGAATLSKELGFDFAGDADEFKRIAGKDEYITFKELATYYAEKTADSGVLEDDWNPDPANVKPILTFQVTDFVDLVLHCHYATRE